MKVSELKPGMLVHSSGIWDARIVSDNSPTQVTLGYRSMAGSSKKSIMMYLGHKKGGFAIHGSKKHHMFLLDNEIALMSGYEIRNLEEVEPWRK